METRPLGNTGLQLPVLSFGASSLGQEFREVDVNEALRSVHVALDLGMNFIDTSPYYGRGMSECLLGVALRGVPRDSYLLGTKLGRYDLAHFDFSAKRVVEEAAHPDSDHLHVTKVDAGTGTLLDVVGWDAKIVCYAAPTRDLIKVNPIVALEDPERCVGTEIENCLLLRIHEQHDADPSGHQPEAFPDLPDDTLLG